MTSITNRLTSVNKRIRDAEILFDRSPGSVKLLAVSKTRTTEEIRLAYAQGQTRFGENYLQEARDKQNTLTDANIQWHFIGPLQSNKTKQIATYFDWVHSVDRLKLAQRLNAHRPQHLGPLNICLQINISGEHSKAGLAPTEAAALAAAMRDLDRLHLRGLMCIPAPTLTQEAQRKPFHALRCLQQSLRAEGHALDTLSMGMSGDLEAAIAEGATLVRVGTDIFGPRTPQPA